MIENKTKLKATIHAVGREMGNIASFKVYTAVKNGKRFKV